MEDESLEVSSVASLIDDARDDSISSENVPKQL